jgi:hypothetical protein
MNHKINAGKTTYPKRLHHEKKKETEENKLINK